jgi:hypothetical protein
MSWSKSISLDVANKLFDVIGVSFEQNELEDGCLTKHEHKTIIRPTFCLWFAAQSTWFPHVDTASIQSHLQPSLAALPRCHLV